MVTLSDISHTTWQCDITAEPKILGRGDSADIRIHHRTVSRAHCRFWSEQGVSYVEDCGSSNGTFVNGEKIQKCKLSGGETIIVGKFQLLVSKTNLLTSTAEFSGLKSSEWPVEASEAVVRSPADEQRQLVEAVHQRLTPSRRLSLPGLLIDAAYSPCGKLGGDCFECFELNDDCWVIAVFDPMNHGTKAALTITLIRSELQDWVSFTKSPGTCLEWINQQIVALGISEIFVCATLAMWFPDEQLLIVSTAGQHYPIWIRDGNRFDLGEMPGGFPLGVAADERYTEELLKVSPGDRLFFFTDGVGELVRSRQSLSSGAAADLIAAELLASSNEMLRAQVQRLSDAQSTELLDDALIIGCEVNSS